MKSHILKENIIFYFFYYCLHVTSKKVTSPTMKVNKYLMTFFKDKENNKKTSGRAFIFYQRLKILYLF